MKFRTTFLLIIFSFSLLLIWDKWVTYSSVDNQSNTSESLQTSDINNDLKRNGNKNNFDSDLPQLKELDVIKPAPIDNVADKIKITSLSK